MAELTHFYNEENTEAVYSATTGFVHAPTSGSNPAQILGSSLDATTKYLIVARALFGSGSATVLPQLRVQTDDDSNIETKSRIEVEFQQTGADAKLSYLFVHSFTTDASPADVEFQVDRDTTTARLDQSSLFLLDLDAIGTEGTDYFEDIQAASADKLSATAATTVLTQLAGSDLGTAEHLILGYGAVTVLNAGRWFDVSLHAADDTSTAAERARHRAEGEDTDEDRNVGFAVRHKASSGTPNVTIYGQREDAGGGQHADGGGYLIALPTSLFADFKPFYTAGAIVVDSTETTIQTSGSYTPTVTGNHLIFGRSQGQDTPLVLGGMWVESTTTEIRTGDATPTHNQIWDNVKDDEFMATFQRYSITTAETFNLRSQGAGSFFDVEDRWLIIVNLNEGGVTNPLNGTVEAVVQTSAIPEQIHVLNVTVDAVSSVSGVAEQVHAATGAVSSVAQASGVVTQIHVLNGTVEAVAVAVGVSEQTHVLTGRVEAVAVAVGTPVVTSDAAGILAHFATMT